MSLDSEAPVVFTPNVVKGYSYSRYRLWRHGDGLLSRLPDSKKFRATWVADECGLDCKCAALIINPSKTAIAELAKAEVLVDPYSPSPDDDERDDERDDV